ncbi:hypothetical protein D3C80_1083610 [compost metagenome]
MAYLEAGLTQASHSFNQGGKVGGCLWDIAGLVAKQAREMGDADHLYMPQLCYLSGGGHDIIKQKAALLPRVEEVASLIDFQQ